VYGGVHALLDHGHEERNEGPEGLGVSHRPDELDDFDAAPAFEVLLDEVLHDGERKGDAAPSHDEDSAGEAGEQGMTGTTCLCLSEKRTRREKAHSY